MVCLVQHPPIFSTCCHLSTRSRSSPSNERPPGYNDASGMRGFFALGSSFQLETAAQRNYLERTAGLLHAFTIGSQPRFSKASSRAYIPSKELKSACTCARDHSTIIAIPYMIETGGLRKYTIYLDAKYPHTILKASIWANPTSAVCAVGLALLHHSRQQD